MSKQKRKPYRIIGAYDSETTNMDCGLSHKAFPVLHQLGLLDGMPIESVDAQNVENVCNVHLYRHAIDLYAKLDELVNVEFDYVPVICCHNLSFDMYGLSPWFDGYGEQVRVLAKSKRKPITFTIRDENGSSRLVLWDTLVFSGQTLARMGEDCGYLKAVGEWDYSLIRTPETALTDDEVDYATKDVYALLAWLGWWLRRNPDIKPERLGLNVVTKTGVVRELRRVRFDNFKGNGNKYNIGRFWHYLNKREQPKTNDELYTMHACTRGGLTFCASRSASVPYDFAESDKIAAGFDATSQHPAQMVSHLYPVGFHECEPVTLEYAFRGVGRVTLDRLLKNWKKPFQAAFYAVFEFDNLRVKPGTLFKRHGIAPLASARVGKGQGDDEQFEQFREHAEMLGYCDTCVNPVFEFGKLAHADKAVLYLTELAAWELQQSYSYDSMRCLGGYITNRFDKPSDMAVISVMQFYKAKNEFKHARETFYNKGTIDNADVLEKLGVPHAITSSMENGSLSDGEVDSYYLKLKSDLNALFGIEASNEFRRDTVLTSDGIDYAGEFGIANAPKNPKAWYQFGQRIVGWSRIAQIAVMELCEPYIEHIVNGDTDSVKFTMRESMLPDVEKALNRYSEAVDRAKTFVCARVKRAYPGFYDPLDGIGHYVLEFSVKRFCASWNKAYAVQDVDKRTGELKFSFTLAGIPARRGANECADYLYSNGWSFARVCNLMLGYNVTYPHSMTLLNARSFPEWAGAYVGAVTDYRGDNARVAEPSALALYPMSKTVNDTANAENAANAAIALRNNPNVNLEPKIIVRTKTGFAVTKLGDCLGS